MFGHFPCFAERCAELSGMDIKSLYGSLANSVPFLGTLNIRGRIIMGTPSSTGKDELKDLHAGTLTLTVQVPNGCNKPPSTPLRP